MKFSFYLKQFLFIQYSLIMLSPLPNPFQSLYVSLPIRIHTLLCLLLENRHQRNKTRKREENQIEIGNTTNLVICIFSLSLRVVFISVAQWLHLILLLPLQLPQLPPCRKTNIVFNSLSYYFINKSSGVRCCGENLLAQRGREKQPADVPSSDIPEKRASLLLSQT